MYIDKRLIGSKVKINIENNKVFFFDTNFKVEGEMGEGKVIGVSFKDKIMYFQILIDNSVIFTRRSDGVEILKLGNGTDTKKITREELIDLDD